MFGVYFVETNSVFGRLGIHICFSENSETENLAGLEDLLNVLLQDC